MTATTATTATSLTPATGTATSASTAARPSTTSPSGPAPCPTNLATSLAHTGGATQLLTVEAPTGTSLATLVAWEKVGSCWRQALGPFSARIGGSGLSDHHREGDGTTPTGAYGIGPVIYGNGPNPGTQYPYQTLRCGDYWDEDVSSGQYNQFVHVPCGTTPSWAAASEGLWRVPVEYASMAVIEYNTDPVIPGRGSGIFLAVAAGHPTIGCVSLAQPNHDTVFRWLNPSAHPLVVIGTPAEITAF
jgi:L,D-peptidoglycan transpeptidase YkuD (ErfK/YbiS/YcfS/YnhG family)